MKPFDIQEYATEFFEPYASTIIQAIEQAFQDCDKMNDYYTQSILGKSVTFHPTYRTHYLHNLVNQRLVEAFDGNPDVKVLEKGGSIELLFEGRVRLKLNKVNDDLSLCTNNKTGKETAYRNPTALGVPFGFAEVAPIYLCYRMREDGQLWDINLIKYDHNERQWHVGIDGSNPDSVQTMKFGGPVVPVISPEQLPAISLKRKNAPGA